MPGYVFYPTADRRQDDIWRYTEQTWGTRQAETYIRNLHIHLGKLAAKELPWRPLPMQVIASADPKTGAYFSRYEHHYIFFRPLSGRRIGILTILHEAMDMPVRLREDLDRLDSAELQGRNT